MQNTLKSSVAFEGVGLHSGIPVRMVVRPAAENCGIWFKRVDVPARMAMVPARWDHVVTPKLCTRIQNNHGVQVSTVEHIMAALAGCGIHNAMIELDAPEVPILDGSSMPFVQGFLAAGLIAQRAKVRAISICKEIEVSENGACARLAPATTFKMDFHIDFEAPAIGRQYKSLCLSNGAFVRDLCDSRTFCSQSDVEAMRANGLALGGSTENAVVFSGSTILSPGGLRHADEPVRHKMLDAMGDLYLAGGPILGRYSGLRAGHALTNKLLHALFADPTAWKMVECSETMSVNLPGVGVLREDLPCCA